MRDASELVEIVLGDDTIVRINIYNYSLTFFYEFKTIYQLQINQEEIHIAIAKVYWHKQNPMLSSPLQIFSPARKTTPSPHHTR